MRKELEEKEGQLMDNLIKMLTKQLNISTTPYYKIKRHSLFTKILEEYPLLYQRDDKIILTFTEFSQAVLNSNFCSTWKLHRKNNKQFKLKKYRIQQYADR